MSFESDSQKGQSLLAVFSHVQLDGAINIAEGFPRQPDITGTVFDQE